MLSTTWQTRRCTRWFTSGCLALGLAALLLAACGGGGGSSSGTNGSGGSSGGIGGGKGGGSSGGGVSGPEDRTITTLANTSGGVYFVSLDAGRLYFSDASDNYIKSVRTDGKNAVQHLQPTNVTGYGPLFKVIKAGSQIYALEETFGGRLLSLPSSSIGAASATTLWSATGDQMPVGFASDGTYLYWVVDETFPSTRARTRVYSIPLAGGAITPNFTDQYVHPTGIAVANNEIFVSTNYHGNPDLTSPTYPTPLRGGTILWLPRDPNLGYVGYIPGTSLTDVRDMAVKGNTIYYILNGIRSIDRFTHVVTDIVPGATNAYRLYVDDTHLYWTVNGIPGELNRIRLNDSTVQVENLYTGEPSRGMTGDSTFVYWATSSGILKTQK